MAGRNPQNVSKLVVWGANSFVTEDDIKLYESEEDHFLWNVYHFLAINQDCIEYKKENNSFMYFV